MNWLEAFGYSAMIIIGVIVLVVLILTVGPVFEAVIEVVDLWLVQLLVKILTDPLPWLVALGLCSFVVLAVYLKYSA